MNQDFFEWLLLLGRWLHIIVGITWIGTSIFFMWLDRTFTKNLETTREGHLGEVWMVHGGGFYHVEKLMMGPTKVPKDLHWFKWEAYWTWMSGVFLLGMIFYTGDGTFLLDPSVSSITYSQAVFLGIFSLIGSWLFYDFLWERKLTKDYPAIGHFITALWFGVMAYLLCKTLSGRAAYIHIGGMIGTWMTANVFMRIIPRQLKMVEASKKGEMVNIEWAKNAKNRSTHNTYLTLPVIFIMLSNHFPMTYGHDYNWLILIFICIAGAAIREYFVSRLNHPGRSKLFGAIGVVIIASVMFVTISSQNNPEESMANTANVPTKIESKNLEETPAVVEEMKSSTPLMVVNIKGIISFEGTLPERKKLSLPGGCANEKAQYSTEVMVANGKVENVLVKIIKGHENLKFPPAPSTPVILDQKNCNYHPRTAAARVGQEVIFVNSDPVFHNVRSISKANTNFNFAMPKKDQRISKRFDKPEFFIQAKCSLHPWMGANLAIMEHPFYAVTNNKGEFEIKDLPEGEYTIEVWHEVFGTQQREITVKKDLLTDVNFIFKMENKK